eukprot:142469-Hanusia_phi.AAC.1
MISRTLTHPFFIVICHFPFFLQVSSSGGRGTFSDFKKSLIPIEVHNHEQRRPLLWNPATGSVPSPLKPASHSGHWPARWTRGGARGPGRGLPRDSGAGGPDPVHPIRVQVVRCLKRALKIFG